MTVIGSLGWDLPEVKSSVNPYISAYINDNQRGAMKIDIYTKAILTVIAVSLSAIAIQMAIGNAYAAGGVTKVAICDESGKYCGWVGSNGQVHVVSFTYPHTRN